MSQLIWFSEMLSSAENIEGKQHRLSELLCFPIWTENSGDVSYPLTYMTDYDKEWIFFPRAVMAVC